MFLCTLLGRRLSLLVRELLAFVEVRRTLTTLAVVFQAYHKFCPVTVLGSPSPYFVRAHTKGSHSRHYYTHNLRARRSKPDNGGLFDEYYILWLFYADVPMALTIFTK